MNINTRELILNILLEIDRDGEHSHIAIRNALTKYQFLPKQDRAFISRVCEGTVEYRLQLDYIINRFSNTKINKMKPVIREILRFSVYQLMYMDSVPDSAVVNEAVKLTAGKGFRTLKNFVNGVLRTIARELPDFSWPGRENLTEYLSVRYSMPEQLVEQWCGEFGAEVCEKMLKSFLEPKPTTVRLCHTGHDIEQTVRRLAEKGIRVEPAPYVRDAVEISGYDHLTALGPFRDGAIQVQDVSSMLVAEAADPRPGDLVLDLCAAPGGKSLHAADKMNGKGMVEARDVTEYKVNLIRDNIIRLGLTNIEASVADATVLREEDKGRADIVLADVPCSGYGVIGRKPDIKYGADPQKQRDLVAVQRKILANAAACVKPGGVLIYSTCTVGKAENLDNVRWFTENFPFVPESLDPYLCGELQGTTTRQGYLQLIPGVHRCDGFFLARLKKEAAADLPELGDRER